jgi:hypothetical protein
MMVKLHRGLLHPRVPACPLGTISVNQKAVITALVPLTACPSAVRAYGGGEGGEQGQRPHMQQLKGEDTLGSLNNGSCCGTKHVYSVVLLPQAAPYPTAALQDMIG